MIAALIITDGREEYLHECVLSTLANLDGPVSEWWMYDDTGDPAHRQHLADTYPWFTHIDGGDRQGFGGAIRAAWAHLREHSKARFVFHVEQDFTFNRPVPLSDMALVLEANPHLVQLALRRQPWNDTERAAGGLVESRADEYTERTHGPHSWLEHRLFFTTNPSLYRRDLIVKHDWPKADQSEGRFSIELAKSPKVRFGFWGPRESGEWVHHIGHDRVGTGY